MKYFFYQILVIPQYVCSLVGGFLLGNKGFSWFAVCLFLVGIIVIFIRALMKAAIEEFPDKNILGYDQT